MGCPVGYEVISGAQRRIQTHMKRDVDRAEEIVDVSLAVGSRRLCNLLEVPSQTFEARDLVELLGRIHHRKLIIVVPV